MTLQRIVRKKMGELLVESGVIDEIYLKEALNIQKEKGGMIGEILVAKGVVTEDEIASCLAIQYGLSYLSLPNYELDEEVLKILPEDFLKKNMCIPVDKMGNVLTVAVTNPLSDESFAKIEEMTNLQVKYFMCTLSDFKQVTEKYFGAE